MSAGAADVSAVVCTLDSISSIEACLTSLRAAGVGQLIVVDASSTDGTREVAEQLADEVVTDPRLGLGHARNVGIERTITRVNDGMPLMSPLDFLDGSCGVQIAGASAGLVCTKKSAPACGSHIQWIWPATSPGVAIIPVTWP